MTRIRTHWVGAQQTALWDGSWDFTTTPYKPLDTPRTAWQSPPGEYQSYGQIFGYPLHNNPNPEDELFEDETGVKTRFKECLHDYEKNEYLYTRFPIISDLITSSNSSALRVNQYVLNNLDNVMPVPEYDMDQLASQAMAFMLPSINEGGFSLPNFILELKELKSLDPRDALRRVKYGSTSLNLLRDKKTRSGFVKDTIRRLTGAHLQAEFGIVPFISDVVGMLDELDGITYKIARLKAHASRPQIRHYKRVLPYSTGQFWPKGATEGWWVPGFLPNLAGDPWTHYYWGVNGQREIQGSLLAKAYVRKKWIVRPTYHATLRYSYELPRFDTEWGEKLAAYTEALGVRLDPSIPWNAMRLSFLVDWVVDVSGFLSSFARENFPLEYKILDFCHSLKWHSESQVDIREPQRLWDLSSYYGNPLPSGYQISDGLIPTFRRVVHHYERKRANPSFLNLVSKRATLRKAALAGSLMIANSRYMKKGRGAYLRALPESIRDLQWKSTGRIR